MFKKLQSWLCCVSIVGFLLLGSGLYAQVPVTNNGTPAEHFSGEQFCFDIDLDNTGVPGFGPYHRLILDPDLSFDSASFLSSGVSVTNVGVFPVAPGNQLTDPRTGTLVTGPEGASMYLLILPMGSIVTGGPTLTLNVCATIDVNSVIGTPLPVTVQTVYEFGDTATGVNGPIVGPAVTSPVTPVLVILTKTASLHEAETAPGPDFPYSYTINVDVANGKTIDNLQINDVLDAALQFVSIDPISGGTGCNATSLPSTLTPGGALTVDCTSVTGTTSSSDMTITYTVYVIDVLDETFCDTQNITNTATLDADYLANPLPQQADQTTITAKHLPIQKGVSPGSGVPGDTVTFTLNFQVTDFGTADSLVITDTMPDGLTFVAHQSFNLGAITPSVSEDGGTGITTIIYDVHAVTGNLAAGTTGSITYTATIDQTYTNPAGLVLAADSFSNTVINDFSLTAGATLCTDGSGATVEIIPVILSKEIVNQQPEYRPGETVTYRLSMTIPSGDTEAIIFDDFFPLPIFDVTTLDLTFGNDIRLDPSDTMGLTPTSITINAGQNSLEIIWPDIHTTSDQTLSVLIDITVESDPFTDNLFLTNLFQASSENTPGAQAISLQPVQIHVRAPVLSLTKGVFASDNAAANATISPVTVPIDGDISASDAADTITFVITTQNTGGAPAHDVIITDTTLAELTGCSIASVVNGKGRSIAFRDPVDVAPPTAPGLPIPTDLSVGILLDENVPPARTFFIEGTLAAMIFTDGGTVGTPDPGDIMEYTAEILNNDGAVTNAIFQISVPTGMTYVPGSLISTLGTTNQAGAPGLSVDFGGMVNAQTATVVFRASIDGGVAPGTGFDVQGTMNSDQTTAEMTDFDNDNANGDQANSLIVGSVLPDQPGAPLLVDSRIIVTYSCTIDASVEPAEVVTNTASTIWASGPGETPFPEVSDGATITMASPTIVKTLTAITPGYAGDLVNVQIGEVLTYQVIVTVPEGISSGVRFIDRVDNGLAVIDVVSIVASSGDITTDLVGGYPGVLAGAIFTNVGGSAYQDDRRLTLDFGNITNVNTDDATVERITIVYRAIVINWTDNDRGDSRNNRADWSWDNPAGGTDLLVRDNAPNVIINEPTLQIAKTVVATTGDAGDTLTVTLDISHTAASNAEAFDVNLEDILPIGFTFASGFTTSGLSADISPSQAAGTITATWNSFPEGSTAQIQFTVTVDNTVTPTEIITNTASIEWESLRDTDQGALPSPPNNLLGVERTGNTADLGTTANDYSDSASDTFTVNNAEVSKVIDSVIPNAATPNITSGDTVTYLLTVRLPEGTTPNLVLSDVLPPGLAFQSATLDTTGFLGFAVLVSSVGDGNVASGETVTMTFNANTTVTAGAGTSNNTFTVDVVALVDGTEVANDGLPALQTKINTVTLNYTGNAGVISDTATTNFAEPNLVITKTMSPDTGLSAGDTVTMTFLVSNTGTAPVYDINITDTLNDAGAELLFDTSSAVEVTTPAGYTYSFTDPTVQWDADGGTSLAAGANVTFVFTATVLTNVVTGSSFDNQVSVTGDSQDGVVAGERTTSDTDTETVSTAEVTSGKSLISSSEAWTSDSSPIEAAIGEVLTYQAVFTLPEGLTQDGSTGGNAIITDTLPAGFQYLTGTAVIRVDSDVSVIGANLAGPLTPIPGVDTAITPTVNGQVLEFNLGDIQNNDDDGNVERIILTYDVLVENTADNNRTNNKTNTVAFTYLNTDGNPQSITDTVSLAIAEPNLSMSKAASPTTVIGGSTVTFTVVYSNPAGTNVTRAWEPVITDTLPARYQAPFTVTSATHSAQGDISACATFTANVLTVDPSTCLAATDNYLGAGESITVIYTADIDPAILFEEQVTNTADGITSSLPGDNGTGGATAGTPGDSDGERTGSGVGENDLNATDTATVIADRPTITKTGDTNLQILETTDMTLSVDVPVGTTNNFVVTDDLPTGLSYTGAVISITLPASNFANTLNPSTTPGAGTDPLVFDFGSITNSDTVPQSITIVYEVSPDNILANQNTTTLQNTVTLSYLNASAPLPSDTATITVIEPDLEVSKTITAGASGSDAGDTIEYTFTVSNTAPTATAFRVAVSDILPAHLLGGTPTFTIISLDNDAGQIVENSDKTALVAGDAVISTTTNTDDTLGFPLLDIPAGATLTVVYNAVLTNDTVAGETLTNTLEATYNSLEAGGGRDSTDSEDDEDGNLDNYGETTTSTLTVDSAIAIQKSLNAVHADNDFTIGDLVTFDVRVDVIEGIIQNVQVTDVLPTGLSYETPVRVVAGANFSFSGLGLAAEAPVGTLTIDMGNVTNAFDGNTANDFFIIEIDARVDDIAGNQDGDALINSVSVTSDAGNAGPDTQAIDIVEPNLVITKVADDSTPSLGDEVTFTITVAHSSSTADAFDVVLTDAIPAGLTYVLGSHSGDGSADETDPTNPVISLGSITLAEMNKSFSISCTVDLDVTVGVTITNNISGVYDGQSGSPTVEREYNNSTTEDVVPAIPAVIDAQKTVTFATGGDLSIAGQIDPGDVLEYTVTLTNGPNPVTNVVFTDPIPTNTTFVGGTLTSSAGTVDESGDPLLLVNVGDMAGAAVVTITFKVTVDAGTPEGTVLSNQGSVDSDQTVPEPTDEDGLDENGDQPTDVIVGGPPAVTNALYVQKLVDWLTDLDGNGFVSATDTLRYYLIIENVGDAQLTDVSITDTIPTGLTYVGGTAFIPNAPPNAITVVGQAVTISIPTLNPHLRQTFLVRFDVTIDAPLVNFNGGATDETFINQADTDSNETDPSQSDGNGNPEDGNQPTVIKAYDTVPGSPELDVEKRWSLFNDVNGDGLVAPGDTIFYLLTIQNISGVDATDVRLTDNVPVSTTMISGSVVTDQGVVLSETPISINIGTIPPGGLVTVSFQVTVDGGTPNGFIIPNQATVTGDDGINEPSDDNGDDSDGKNPTLTPVVTGGSSAGSPSGLSKILFATSEADSSGNNVFIGEVLTYRVAFDVPAGTLHEVTLSDVLPTGLAYLSETGQLSRTFETGLLSSEDPGGINATATGVFTSLADGSDLTVAGSNISLFLGDMINSDNDANVETYTLELQVLVENIVGNDAGDTLTNTAGLSYMNGLGGMQALTPVNHATTIIEPSLSVTKASDPTMVTTAGGDVTFTVTITNPSGAFTASGYNVQVVDTLSAEWLALSVDSLTPTGGVAGVVDNSAGTTLSIDIATFPEDGQLIIVYTATSDNPLATGTLTNTATATWTSLPGDHGTGGATAGNPGDADGERTGPSNGAPNDYTAQDTADLSVGDPSIAKVLTSGSGRYAIGDVASYQVSISMPPNSSVNNAAISDVLDEGLTYVSNSLAITWNGLTTTTAPAPTEFTRTDNSPVAGRETLALDLTTFANNTGGTLTLVLTYNALVDNILVNQNNQNLNNLVTFSYDDPGGSSTISHNDTTQLTVGEPHLTLSKTITSAIVNLDAGDTVDFQVVAGNTGTTTAFNVVLSDVLPAGLGNAISINVTGTTGGAETPTFTNNGTDWTSSAFDIPVGGTVTITFTATLTASVEPGQTIQNSVSGSFTSRDGTDTNERDGSDPGSQQDDGNLDNYNESNSAPVITVNDPIAIDKSFTPDPANDTYTIGETFIYRLSVSVIEGVTQELVVTDTLPPNLRYLSDSRGFGMNFTPQFNPNASQVAQTLSWDFGDVSNTANGNGADDSFTIDITVIVEDVTPANVDGAVLTNNASLTFTDGVGGTQTRDYDSDSGTGGIQGLDLTIVEPDVTITKTPNPTTVSHGDEVTFTILLDHTVASTSDAFDLIIVDTLPVGLTYVPGSANIAPAVAGQVLTFNIASLTLLDDQTSIIYRASVDLDVSAGAILTNTAGLTYTSMPGSIPDERTYTDSDDAPVTVAETTIIDAQKIVELLIDADGSSDVTPFDTLRYTVTIVNNGADAHNVVFTDVIPNHSALSVGTVTTSQGSVVSGNLGGDINVQVDIGTMLDGGSVTITFQTTVDAGTPEGTIISNQGYVDSDETEPEPTDEDGDDSNGDQPTDVHVGGPPAVVNALYVQKRVVMVIDVNGNGDVNPGDTLRYSLIFENRGDEILTNVTIDDVIPAGLTFLVASETITGGTNPIITVTAPNVAITIDALAPGLREIGIATFDVTVDAPLEDSSGDADPNRETFVNQADTASDQTPDGLSDGNGDPGDGSQPTRITGVTDGTPGAPALDVEKRWNLHTDVNGDGLVNPGDIINYTITLENYGSADAIDVRLADTLDPLLTIVPGSLQTSQGVVVTETPININIGDMPVGAFVTISLQAVVDASTPNGTVIPNQATATGNNFPDEPSDDNGDDNDGKNPTLTPVVTGGGGAGTPGGLTKTLVVTSETGSLGTDTFIGEVLTYRVSFDVPAGNLREVTLVDTLPTGLAYLSGTAFLSRTFETGLVSSENPGGINATATDNFIAIADGTELIQTGQDLGLFLGVITNSDNDGNAETYTLQIDVIVENTSGNQAGTTLTNSATVHFYNNLNQPQNLTPAIHTTTVTEANLAVAKGSDPTMVTTSGGDVTFTVTVTNPAAGNSAIAYNTNILDVLSADWNLVTIDSITPSVGVTGITDNTAGTTIDIDVATFPVDGQLVIVYTATTINPPPSLSTPMTNTAVVTWTSLPGDHGTGDGTSGNPGDVDGERTGPANGDPNDYIVQDSTDVVVGNSNIVKTIVPLQTRYAIGDEVFYTVQVSLPPTATLNASSFEDILDLGLTYVTASLVIDMDGVTSTTAPAEFTRTDDAPTVGEETLALDLGTLDNANSMTRTLVFTYRALVDNILTNQNGLDLNNAVTFSYDDPGGGARVVQTDTQVMTVGEPHLTMDKSITSVYVDLDAGDTIDFDVVIGNDGNLTAFDVVVSDTLPVGLENVTAISVTASSGGAEVPTFTNNGTDWLTSAFDLPVGASVTISFTAELAVTVVPGQSIQNTATASFTSRDGADPNERDGSTSGSDQDDDTDLNNYNTSDPSAIIVVGDPIAINKEFYPITTQTTYTIGDSLGYRLTISILEGTVDDLTIVDNLPAGLRYESVVVGVGNVGIIHGYVAPPIVAGQVITLELLQVVNPANGDTSDDYLTVDLIATVENVIGNQDGTILTNNASLSFTGPSGTETRDYDSDLGTPGIQGLDLEIVEPDLQIIKSVNPVDVWPGTNTTYTLVVDHTLASRADAYDIVVVDTLPIGITFVPGSASIAPVSVVGQVITFEIPVLTLVDDQFTITYHGLVDVNAVLGVPLINTVFATYTTQTGVHPDERTGDDGVGGLNDLITNEDTAQVIPTRPVVSVEKVDALIIDSNGDGVASPGETLEYTVTIVNSGNASANNVVFTDTPDNHTAIVPGSITTSQGTVDAGQAGTPPIVVSIGELLADSTVTITFQVQIDEPLDPAVTALSNQGTLMSDELEDILSDDPDDTTSTEDTTDTSVFQVDLSIVKSDDIDPVALGNGDVTYTLVIENHGPSDATEVLVTDVLPVEFTYVSSTTTVGTDTYNAVTHEVVFDIGALANGGTVTCTITVTPTVEGVFTNTATVEVLQHDYNTDNDSDDEDTTVVEGVDLSIVKQASNTNPDYNEIVTFTIRITNDGPSVATGIVVEDTWPAGLVYLSHTTTSGTYTNASKLWNIASMNPGTFEDLVIQARVMGLGIQRNLVEVTECNEFDLDSTPGNSDPDEDDISWVDLEVNDALDLALLKTILGPVLPYPGAEFSYRLEVQNLGPAPSFGTIATDNLPAEVSFLSATATQGSYDPGTGLWDIGYMDPGDVHFLTIEVQIIEDIPVGTIITNYATVTSDLIDINLTNNDDEAPIGVVAGVPTLSEWMLILFSTLIGLTALYMRRRS